MNTNLLYKPGTRVNTTSGTGFVTSKGLVKLDNEEAEPVSLSEVLYVILDNVGQNDT